MRTTGVEHFLGYFPQTLSLPDEPNLSCNLNATEYVTNTKFHLIIDFGSL